MLTLKDTRVRADAFVDFYSRAKKERDSKNYLQSILSQVAFHTRLGGKQPAGGLWTMQGGCLQEQLTPGSTGSCRCAAEQTKLQITNFRSPLEVSI